MERVNSRLTAENLDGYKREVRASGDFQLLFKEIVRAVERTTFAPAHVTRMVLSILNAPLEFKPEEHAIAETTEVAPGVQVRRTGKKVIYNIKAKAVLYSTRWVPIPVDVSNLEWYVPVYRNGEWYERKSKQVTSDDVHKNLYRTIIENGKQRILGVIAEIVDNHLKTVEILRQTGEGRKVNVNKLTTSYYISMTKESDANIACRLIKP